MWSRARKHGSTLHSPIHSTFLHIPAYCTLHSLHWGVSDHHKVRPEPIFFLKQQFALMDHTIFMKQIGSIVFFYFFFYTKSLRICFGGILFYFCGFWELFHVWKPYFWIFIQKNFLLKQILKCLTVEIYPYLQNQQNVVTRILK